MTNQITATSGYEEKHNHRRDLTKESITPAIKKVVIEHVMDLNSKGRKCPLVGFCKKLFLEKRQRSVDSVLQYV